MKFDVEGLAPFINRLEKFDKDVSKELKAEMKKGADVVAKAAGSTVSGVPISGWGTWNHQGRDLGYNPSKVKSGFKVATNRYRRRGVTAAFGYDVVQANAGGSVYEVIGDKSRVTGPQGEQFVDSVVAASSGRRNPRTLVPAYYEGIEQARERIKAALKDAMRKVGM